MDEIKDAGMMLDYTEDALDMDMTASAMWFKNHAKARIDMLKSDYDYIAREIGLVEKAKGGDAIADALMCHLDYQISELNHRLNAI